MSSISNKTTNVTIYRVNHNTVTDVEKFGISGIFCGSSTVKKNNNESKSKAINDIVKALFLMMALYDINVDDALKIAENFGQAVQKSMNTSNKDFNIPFPAEDTEKINFCKKIREQLEGKFRVVCYQTKTLFAHALFSSSETNSLKALNTQLREESEIHKKNNYTMLERVGLNKSWDPDVQQKLLGQYLSQKLSDKNIDIAVEYATQDNGLTSMESIFSIKRDFKKHNTKDCLFVPVFLEKKGSHPVIYPVISSLIVFKNKSYLITHENTPENCYEKLEEENFEVIALKKDILFDKENDYFFLLIHGLSEILKQIGGRTNNIEKNNINPPNILRYICAQLSFYEVMNTIAMGKDTVNMKIIYAPSSSNEIGQAQNNYYSVLTRHEQAVYFDLGNVAKNVAENQNELQEAFYALKSRIKYSFSELANSTADLNRCLDSQRDPQNNDDDFSNDDDLRIEAYTRTLNEKLQKTIEEILEADETIKDLLTLAKASEIRTLKDRILGGLNQSRNIEEDGSENEKEEAHVPPPFLSALKAMQAEEVKTRL